MRVAGNVVFAAHQDRGSDAFQVVRSADWNSGGVEEADHPEGLRGEGTDAW